MQDTRMKHNLVFKSVILDRIFTFLIKSFIIGSGYFFSRLLGFIRRSEKLERSYNTELFVRAFYEVHKQEKWNPYLISWLIESFADFLALDQAFEVRFRKVTKRYFNLIKRNKSKIA